MAPCTLVAPLAARCGLAEQMYHTVRDAKRILGSLHIVPGRLNHNPDKFGLNVSTIYITATDF